MRDIYSELLTELIGARATLDRCERLLVSLAEQSARVDAALRPPPRATLGQAVAARG